MKYVINLLEQEMELLEEKLNNKYCLTIDKEWIKKEKQSINNHIKQIRIAINILIKGSKEGRACEQGRSASD